ncbi:hypothetical protein ACLOJK_034730 [Asimina triloba]
MDRCLVTGFSSDDLRSIQDVFVCKSFHLGMNRDIHCMPRGGEAEHDTLALLFFRKEITGAYGFPQSWQRQEKQSAAKTTGVAAAAAAAAVIIREAGSVAIGDEMTSARHRSSPFTATQWQELEHQALIFKYMLYGIPVPPDLLYSMKRGWDLPITPNLPRFFPQHPSGWGCFQVGFGRKGTDPEPGRCRRTDGKKWRCSKEAFPDSKYCERHMHRGRNRSRKPVESTPTTPPSAPSTNPSSSSSPCAAAPARTEHPFLQPHSSKAVGMPMGIPNLDSLAYSSSAVKDYRYLHGLKENVVDEHAFFSESSGSLKSIPDSSLDMSWRSMKRASAVLSSSYYSQLQQQRQVETDIRERQQQPLRLFFDEWPPPKNRSSWLDLEVDPSDRTQLSISIPTTDSHLPNSR